MRASTLKSWKESLAEMIRLVQVGEVPMSRIDDAVTRILRMKLRLGLFDRRRRVVVVGSHADNVAYQCGGWTKKWQGAHTDLYGHPARPVAGATSILAGIREVIGAEDVVDAGVAGFSDAAEVAIVVVVLELVPSHCADTPSSFPTCAAGPEA